MIRLRNLRFGCILPSQRIVVSKHLSTMISPSDKVKISRPEKVQLLMEKLKKGGPDKLHLVTDFDRTLSRTHYHGREVSTSYCVFEDDTHVSEDYRRLAVELREKYYPIEIDPNLTSEQKLPYMIEWYKESFGIILKAGVNKKDLPGLVQKADLHLREGTKDLFARLSSLNVPILVFSAGLGDVVRLSLEQQGALFPNVTVISNFLEYDDKGMPLKFNDKLLHMYNKNAEYAEEYYQSHKSRENALLLGDSLGDCTMVQGGHYSNVLRIGFLDHQIEERLESYMTNYDIVLIDDQTMDVVAKVLEEIL